MKHILSICITMLLWKWVLFCTVVALQNILNWLYLLGYTNSLIPFGSKGWSLRWLYNAVNCTIHAEVSRLSAWYFCALWTKPGFFTIFNESHWYQISLKSVQWMLSWYRHMTKLMGTFCDCAIAPTKFATISHMPTIQRN